MENRGARVLGFAPSHQSANSIAQLGCGGCSLAGALHGRSCRRISALFREFTILFLILEFELQGQLNDARIASGRNRSECR